MKKSDNYDKLFQGVSVQDIATMEEWNIEWRLAVSHTSV